MDNDTISRQAIKEKLQEHYNFFVDVYGGFENMPSNIKLRVDEITNCIAEVVNMPAVQPEQKTGYWIGEELGECSNCGHSGCASDIWNGCEQMFCPNCGAKMESEVT